MSKQILATGLFAYQIDTNLYKAYGVTNLSLDKNLNEVDLTDTLTTGDEKEYQASRQEVPFTVEIWKQVDEADPPIGSIISDVRIDFEGYEYSGSAIFLSIKNSVAIDDGIKMTIEGRFTGGMTETQKTIGAEELTSPNFNSDTGWTISNPTGVDCEITGGELVVGSGVSAAASVTNDFTPTSSTEYMYLVRISSCTSGSVIAICGALIITTPAGEVGTFLVFGDVGTTGLVVQFGVGSFRGAVTAASVKEIA